MTQNQLNEKLFLKSKLLEDESAFHFFSTKIGWNGLSRFTGDHFSEFEDSRRELATFFGRNVRDFVFPRQVHGNRVVTIRGIAEDDDIPETDALITDKPNICLCVQTADCVPILLFDPVGNVAGAVHSGWRGTVGKIVAKTIEEMQRQFGCKTENVLATIGPSISGSAYEVGEEVISKVKQAFQNHHVLLNPTGVAGKAHFNLWEANKTLLLDAGLTDNHIEVIGSCTYSMPDLFYSARRDGTRTGRMVSGITINTPKSI